MTTEIPELKYDDNGLIPAIVQDIADNEIVMVGYMNAESLRMTLDKGLVTFWSRSRGRLWKKGETSGNVLRVVEMRIDCDQDAVWIIADPAGPACHTGATSCFYRRIDGDRLIRVA